MEDGRYKGSGSKYPGEINKETATGRFQSRFTLSGHETIDANTDGFSLYFKSL